MKPSASPAPENRIAGHPSTAAILLATAKTTRRLEKGFAMVVVVSLMVLLLILAVGLLSLASIEIRSSGQGAAMERARANARLALQLAVGQLQLNAGPDKRITAASDILATKSETSSPNRMTGVWNSRKLDPANPASLYTKKESDFKGWLVSNSDEAQTKSQDFGAKGELTNPVTLFSDQTLGDTTREIRAGKVGVRDSLNATTPTGYYAYSVQDEGLKARIDLGEAPAAKTNLTAQTETLGAGQNPGLDRLKTSSGSYFAFPADPNAGLTMISRGQADMAFGQGRGEFYKKFNDLTPYSLGLLTDVANGGFKKDLNLMADSVTPPAEFAGRGIYESALGFKVESDPTWNQALGFARLFNDPAKLRNEGGTPVLLASAPSNWNALNGDRQATKSKPSGPVLMPAVAKVQVVFSLAARDMFQGHKDGAIPMAFPTAAQVPTVRPQYHSPWGHIFNGKEHDGNKINPVTGNKITPGTDYNPIKQPSSFVYLLHLVYSPIITLHNPYNVAIEFPSLQVDFRNVPFRMQILRNGQAQTTEMLTFRKMSAGTQFLNNADKELNEKRFGLKLQNSIAGGGAIRMLPGEVRVFATEVAGMENFVFSSGGPWATSFWDINNKNGLLQKSLTATSGWRGEQYGLDMDWLQGAKKISGGDYDIDTNGVSYNRQGTIPLRSTDTVQARFAPLPDVELLNSNKFSVEVTLPGANSDPSARTSVVEFDYLNEQGLRDELKETWTQTEKQNGYLESPVWKAFTDLNDHYSRTMANQKNVKPFALFSAYAKTTHGAENGATEEGSFAGKPWMFNNYTGAVSHQQISKAPTDHPSLHPYEINMEALPGDTSNAIEVVNGRGNFISGHTSVQGIKFGTMHDIPLGPIQNVVSLNSANIGTSYYNPTFVAPIGNSYAHPMLATSVITDGLGGADHSYLLNSVLFDGFYCSGVQANSSSFGDGRDVGKIVTDFFATEGHQPLTDHRLVPYLPAGMTNAVALDDLQKSDGYKNAAAFMLLKGSFNVNSTSVEAWKAMLAGLPKTGGKVQTANAGASNLVDLAGQQDSKGARFSRFRLPNAQNANDSKESYFQGIRELSESELNGLAEAIVAEVKRRGPFLSMGEFVNRQVGGQSNQTQKGALQAAIDEVGFNERKANLLSAGYNIDSTLVDSYEIPNPRALDGSSAQGAPGFLTQADLLSALGNAVTVRSDTFVIRTYGDAVDSKNKVIARAYCEAVVQRMPEYVNKVDAATVQTPTSPENVNFGRRFQIQSFRWLSPDEV